MSTASDSRMFASRPPKEKRRHSRAVFLKQATLGVVGTVAAIASAAASVPSPRWKGKRNSTVKRWDIITIGNLSRNRYWGESDARGVRPAICTCTVIQGDGFRLIVDPSLAKAEQMTAELDRRTGLGLHEIDSVFVTHDHGDHWFGLAHFLEAKWFAAPEVAGALNKTGKLPKRVEPASVRLFGAIDILPTPGHTLSHHSLRLFAAVRLGLMWSAISLVAGTSIGLAATVQAVGEQPVLLYSRYFNAEGEARYLPEGTYQQVLQRLQAHFKVRVSREPLTASNLAGVKVILIANPSDQAVGGNPAPHHFTAGDIKVLNDYVRNGGGLIIMGNQENHNLEVEDTNKLMAGFGLAFTNLYTDVKRLTIPRSVPVIGGLSWAFYTGNLLTLDTSHPARPRALVTNDLSQTPLNGTRDQPGVLLALAEPGRGRVVAATDAGWITNDVLANKGIGGVVITNHDNWEIFRRLAAWAAGLGKLPPKVAP